MRLAVWCWMLFQGVIGWCKGVVFLRSLECPTDIGLQLGKPCYPNVAGKVEGKSFHFFCFFPFIPVPLSSLFLSFIFSTISSISFLPFSGRRHKMIHKGWLVVKSPTQLVINAVSQAFFSPWWTPIKNNSISSLSQRRPWSDYMHIA